MLIKHLGNLDKKFSKTASLFSDYRNTSNTYRKAVDRNANINKIKKSKSKNLTIPKNQLINEKCNTIYSIRTSSTLNSMNYHDYKKAKNKQSKTCTNFYPKINTKLRLRNFQTNEINNNNDTDKFINIINFSKITSIYDSKLSSARNNNLAKPPFRIKPKKLNEFNSLEKYISKAHNQINEIKHEYKPNLGEFYINKQLKNYIKKSKNMIHAKDDLNILYKDSHILNSICDYVSNSMFKLRIKKRNNIKKMNKEINNLKIEKLKQSIMKMKARNKEVPEENLYIYNNFYSTYNNFEFNPKLKAKLIYQSCYHSNSIKTVFDRINYKREFNSLLKNKIKINPISI